ncbi:hypothetical protein J2X31_003306 [Flavobacterium arsenatis]|uniref:Uncharacterized protein n=1 Tax=Flavobacterium arsenatis TaxID=1484332 RepID=A0ABU1TTV3_9FLAO|nr:hypothetical protein [Flavobacterium arsenatis]MDR6969276.1 hypothetical protein [Flavobacterium arsenatis]
MLRSDVNSQAEGIKEQETARDRLTPEESIALYNMPCTKDIKPVFPADRHLLFRFSKPEMEQYNKYKPWTLRKVQATEHTKK